MGAESGVVATFSCITSLMSSQVDFLVFGATGYFGSHVVKHVKAQGYSCVTSSTRIEQREAVTKDIEAANPKYVVCAAGLAGTPNIVCTRFETATHHPGLV